MAWYSARVRVDIVEHDEGSKSTKGFWNPEMEYHNLGYEDVLGLQVAGMDFLKKLEAYGLENAKRKKGGGAPA